MNVRIDQGEADRLPAAILPTYGDVLPGFVQENPHDAASGRVRLLLVGVQAAHPGWDGVIAVADGDIHHWIHISANEAVSMQGFLTPRLTKSLDGSEKPDMKALADSLSHPERLAAQLRSAELAGEPAAITGHLIGAELAAARAYWLGQQVTVLEDPPLKYSEALKEQGVPVLVASPSEMSQAGHIAVTKALGL